MKFFTRLIGYISRGRPTSVGINSSFFEIIPLESKTKISLQFIFQKRHPQKGRNSLHVIIKEQGSQRLVSGINPFEI